MSKCWIRVDFDLEIRLSYKKKKKKQKVLLGFSMKFSVAARS